MSGLSQPVGCSSFNNRATLIGLHADHRPQDIYFSRTQSAQLRDAEWESRIKPLRSWSQIILWVLAVLMFVGEAINLVR